MKKNLIYIVMLIAVLLTASCAKEEVVAPQIDQPEQAYEEGMLLVKLSTEVTEMLEQAGVTRAAVSRTGAPSLDEVLELIGGYELERVFPYHAASEEQTRACGLNQWFVVRFGEEFTASEVADRLSKLGEVQRINFNHTIKRAYTGKVMPLKREALEQIALTRSTMNDPLYSVQWNLANRGDLFLKDGVVKCVAGADVQCEAAWEITRGNDEIIVAVLDEGVFVEHPDLKANIWVNTDEVAGSLIDNDGNGYVGDIHGYNFIKEMPTITWNDYYDSGHGTHVAGVIAAVNDNNEGISSIAGGSATKGGVKIMSCQVFSGQMSGNSLQVVRAVKYAADNGAVVLQCSWGFTSGAANIYDWGAAGPSTQEEFEAYAPLEKAALDYFVHHAGSPNGTIDGGIVVFAAGNESAAMAGYPGADPSYVSVAGTAADFTAAVYTNYGKGTDISAPGGDQDYYYEYVDDKHNYGELGCILSTLPYHASATGYGYMEGTSMACPHVSGVIALTLSSLADERKQIKASELKELISQTATPIDSYQNGYKKYCRYVADVGPIRPMTMYLPDYRGGMGAGQINALQLIGAAAQKAIDVRFPNLYIGEGKCVVVDPSLYFKGGDEMSYTISIADESIAVCDVEQGKLYFKGYKVGATTGVITTSKGQHQQFAITVRSAVNDNGWL